MPSSRRSLRDDGLRDVQQYAWPRVRQRWADVYASALAGSRIVVRGRVTRRSRMRRPLHALRGGTCCFRCRSAEAPRRSRIRRDWRRRNGGRRRPSRQLQLDACARLLAMAAAHVPYYRDCFAGSRHSIRRIASPAPIFARCRFSTKAAFARTRTSMKSDARAGAPARCNTGGSSGEPLVFFSARSA